MLMAASQTGGSQLIKLCVISCVGLFPNIKDFHSKTSHHMIKHCITKLGGPCHEGGALRCQR